MTRSRKIKVKTPDPILSQLIELGRQGAKRWRISLYAVRAGGAKVECLRLKRGT